MRNRRRPVTFFQAVLHERCPRCREGPLFRGPLWRGSLAMHACCSVCGLRYEREPGYFLGAMYFSYALSIPGVLVLILVIWRVSGWSYDVVIGAAVVAWLPFVPAVTRWARVLWIHFDRYIDP
ncbi:MAG TPA: DUF983 domain-containing protein [Bryobacteraceae bacterium]|nr:DUF983 domain-containing protein [Bryobacteraceae bacterium]